MSGISGQVVRQIKDAAKAATTNEQITRQRVEQIELWLIRFTSMGFWRRLRWLILGR